MIPLHPETSRGSWLFDEKGGVYALGDAPFYGAFSLGPTERIVAVGNNNPQSYYAVTNKARIISCGNMREDRTLIDLSPGDEISRADIKGGSVAILTNQGKLFVFSLGDENVSEPLCSIDHADEVARVVLTASGKGTYVLFTNGRIQTTGDAQHFGDLTTEKTDAHAVDIAQRVWGEGYWILDDIGGIFCFGDADYFGSVPEDRTRINAAHIVPHFSGRGYWIIDQAGMLLPFGYANIYDRDHARRYENIVGFIPYVIDASQSALGVRNTIRLAQDYARRDDIGNNEESVPLMTS